MASIFLLLAILFSGWLIVPGDLPGFEFCLFRRYFHLDCPGCGLTRAFLLIPRGQVSEALALNWGCLSLYVLFLMMLFHRVFGAGGIWRMVGSRAWLKSGKILSLATAGLLLLHWLVKLSTAINGFLLTYRTSGA